MIKITTISATVLTTLTLFGMAQPIVSHADQVQASPTHQTAKNANIQTKADTDIVNIPDANLKAAIKEALQVTDDADITKEKLASYSGTLDVTGKKVSDVTGLNYMTSLKDLTLEKCDLTQDVFQKIDFNALKNLSTLSISSNHLINTSTTSSLVINPASGTGSNWERHQTYTEPTQTIVGNKKLTIDVSNYMDRAGKGSAYFTDISDGGVYDPKTNTITWDKIGSTVSKLTFTYKGSSYLSGVTTVPIEHKKDDAPDISVSYDAKVSDPQWYGVVPADVSFDDKTKEVNTDVKLVQDVAAGTAYSGSKSVDVTVQSDNAYQLKDANNKTVEYKLDKDGKSGTFFDANNKPQELGTLNKTTPSISSMAHLTGTATESGKYVDTLHYVFAEK